jgi:cell division protein FtsB
MNSTIIGILVLVLILVWFGTNALWAVALFNNKKDELTDKFSGQDPAIDELHKRVEELKDKK